MSTVKEQGHLVNLAEFNKMLLLSKRYGTRYSPYNTAITSASLQTTLDTGTLYEKEARTKTIALRTLKNERKALFKSTRKLSTQVYRALLASNPDKAVALQAASYLRLIRGQRADTSVLQTPPPVVNTPAVASADPAAETNPPAVDPTAQPATANLMPAAASTASAKAKTNSVSHQGFAQLTGYFDSLVTLIEQQPGYLPNEPQLSASALRNLVKKMQQKNDACYTGEIDTKGALLLRDSFMYTDALSMYELFRQAKSYFRSILELGSEDMKEVTRLYFTKFIKH